MSKYSKQALGSNNNQTCSCGQHRGKGDATPHEMALMYNWFRQRGHADWARNDSNMVGYLTSYEAAHGRIGENEFLFNTGRFA